MTQEIDTANSAPATKASASVVALDLKEKDVVFVLVQEGSCIGANLSLPGGAYIQGDFSGTIICAKGALIIAKGATLSGYAEADEIYIAGEIGQRKGEKGSSLLGRNFIAVSEDAIVHGDLTSRMFNVNSKNIHGQIRTLI
jgi:cytoskeletal protein CcmA (bactofilin family)